MGKRIRSKIYWCWKTHPLNLLITHVFVNKIVRRRRTIRVGVDITVSLFRYITGVKVSRSILDHLFLILILKWIFDFP